jgi:hypothetical protein
MKTKTSEVHASLAENYFRKSCEYRDSMNQALADHHPTTGVVVQGRDCGRCQRSPLGLTLLSGSDAKPQRNLGQHGVRRNQTGSTKRGAQDQPNE